MTRRIHVSHFAGVAWTLCGRFLGHAKRAFLSAPDRPATCRDCRRVWRGFDEVRRAKAGPVPVAWRKRGDRG